MHTLSLFPALFTYTLVAPLLLRLAVAYYIIGLGSDMYKNGQYKWLSFIYFIVGAFLTIGLYTQAVAIVGIISIKLNWWIKRKVTPTPPDQMTLYIICGVILLSLLVTGPGAFAIDLPL